MHPEIKKFWEKAGHTLYHTPPPMDLWEVHIHTGGDLPIYRIETVCHGNEYRFDNHWYSESEMLRVIRLKAFL